MARKSKLDKLIDKLEEITIMNQELMRFALQTPLVALPPKVKQAIGGAAKIVEPVTDDIRTAYFDGLRAGARAIQSERSQEAFSQIEATDIIGPAKPVLPKPRSPKQRKFQKKQSAAFSAANKAVRKKNGQFRKGKSQRDVAKMAQRILRNGGTKKGQVRKTARRAYEAGRRKRSR